MMLLGRNSNSLDSKNKSSKVRKVKKLGLFFLFLLQSAHLLQVFNKGISKKNEIPDFKKIKKIYCPRVEIGSNPRNDRKKKSFILCDTWL